MQICVVVGGSSEEKYRGKKDQLKILYGSPKLILSGDNDVKRFELKDGRKAFLAGHLDGIRSTQNEIIPYGYSSAVLEELIRTKPIEECREVLEGRFVLVVSGPGDACTISADRYGRYDLYYQKDDKATVFASDLGLLPVHPAQKGFDQVGLAHTLCVFGFRPPKRHTLYQGVRRLGVGEIANIENGEVNFTDLPFEPIKTFEYGNRELNKYADLLLDAVRVRSSRYGNIVYLSSGWDSTAILACLVHLHGANKVRAVILRMLLSERSGVVNRFEIDRAKAIAEYYGVRLDIVDLDLRSQIPSVLEKFQPVLKNHHVISMTCLSHGTLAEFVSRTSNGDEAVFAGEISDGVHNLGFSQYTTIFHPVFGFREYSDKMASYLFGPTFLNLMHNREFINDPIYQFFRARSGDAIFDEPQLDEPAKLTKQLLASFFLRSSRLPLWSLRNNKMLSKTGAAKYSNEMESIYLDQPAEVITPETLYAWYLHLYNSFHWQGSTISTLTFTAEAEGFEVAFPFWDSRLQEFLSAMPENWGRGLDLNPTKYPLKWMLEHQMDYPMHLQKGPHSYLYDIDPSFNLAAETLYASALTDHYKEKVRNRAYRNILSNDMFKLDYVDLLVNQYLEGAEVHGQELSDLVLICWFSALGWHEK